MNKDIKKKNLINLMKLTTFEKYSMKRRLNQLKKFMVHCLQTKKYDDYLNTINSNELRALEQTIIMQDYSCSQSPQL